MPLNLFCVGHLLLIIELALKTGLYSHFSLDKTNFSFISGYLGEVWELVSTFPVNAETPSATDLFSLCEFISMPDLLCLENLDCLVSSIPSDSSIFFLFLVSRASLCLL